MYITIFVLQNQRFFWGTCNQLAKKPLSTRRTRTVPLCSARALSSVRARRKAPGAFRASSTSKRWGAPQMGSSNEIIPHNITFILYIWFDMIKYNIYIMCIYIIMYIYIYRNVDCRYDTWSLCQHSISKYGGIYWCNAEKQQKMALNVEEVTKFHRASRWNNFLSWIENGWYSTV